MGSNKTIRLRTTPGNSNNIQVKIEQEFDTLDILSLKITQEDAYRNFCSDYGVVAGRVIANDGFGVENAKVSIFIPLSDVDADNTKITTLYPYRTPNELNSQGIRYNLLPKNGRQFYIYEKIPLGESPEGGVILSGPNAVSPTTQYFNEPDFTPLGSFVDVWEQSTTLNEDNTVTWKRLVNSGYGPSIAVGTFPNKGEILDNDIVLEVYDKYFKLSTRTNSSGDYMIFGVPVGNQTVHMDVDFSDTGSASLTVEDFLNAGIPETFFSEGSFTTSTNLDTLPQIESRNISVDVVPFWGNLDQCVIGITRLDFNLNKTISPSASLIFQAFTNNYNNSIDKDCGTSTNNSDFRNIGNMKKLPNTTTLVRSFDTSFERTTTSNGNVLVNVPMEKERFITNEFGNLEPSPDGIKGIPTAGKFSFYFWSSSEHVGGNGTEGTGGHKLLNVTLRYDIITDPKNKKKLIYTLGNRNQGQNSGTNNYRNLAIQSVSSNNNINDYPSSFERNGENRFGLDGFCYGSLYFPRFAIKNNGNFCEQIASLGSTIFPTPYEYQNVVVDGLMDITDIIGLFSVFGGSILGTSSTTNNDYNSATWIGSNGVDLRNQTIPLRNSSMGVTDPIFPFRLNSDQVVYNNSIQTDSLQSGDVYKTSNTGRYFFYWGLHNDNNALTNLKNTLGV